MERTGVMRVRLSEHPTGKKKGGVAPALNLNSG
jgi:hypothetical protein